jgi:hypothetical protein
MRAIRRACPEDQLLAIPTAIQSDFVPSHAAVVESCIVQTVKMARNVQGD